MGFENFFGKPKAEEKKPENALGLSAEEQAFMDRANMTPAQLAQYKRWKKLEEELGGMDKAA